MHRKLAKITLSSRELLVEVTLMSSGTVQATLIQISPGMHLNY